MGPLVVLMAEPGVDLSPLTRQLWAHRIVHRVVFKDGKQCLLLADPANLDQVRQWVEEWQAGTLRDPDNGPVAAGTVTKAMMVIGQAPVAFVMILAWLLLYAVLNIQPEWLFEWTLPAMEYWPEQRSNLEAWFSAGIWEFLRPALLHFSLVHLLFNLFWWWILARPIEHRDGLLSLLVVMLVAGLVGNGVQWWFSGPGFGGASGIVFGAMGWLGWRQLRGMAVYDVPPAMLPLMAGWMLLTILGDQLIPGLTNTAHGAHLGGLVSGILLAMIWPSRQRGTS
ncbi:MAG: hypothetical protein CMI09_05130 [Oceanospirillaceae bacterium]|nr:hypothetical protein [Oceanospirillaceae bacterium]